MEISIKWLTVLLFASFMFFPAKSVFNEIKQFSGPGLFNQLEYLAKNLQDEKKLEQLSNKADLKRHAIGLRNYIHYLIREKRIKHVYIKGDEERWLLLGIPPIYANESLVRPDFVEEFSQILEQQKIPFFVMSTPGQSNYYELRYSVEKTLKGSSEPIRKTAKIDRIHFIDSFNIIKQNANRYLLYSPLDHHPNDLGAYLTFTELTKALNSRFKDRAPLLDETSIVDTRCRIFHTNKDNSVQDEWGWVIANTAYVLNIGKYHLPFTYCYPRLNNNLLEKRIEAFNFKDMQPLDFKGKKHQRSLWYQKGLNVLTRNNSPLSDLKVLVVGNSMKINLSTYYTRYFQTTVTQPFLGMDGKSVERSAELLKLFEEKIGRPDAVIAVF